MKISYKTRTKLAILAAFLTILVGIGFACALYKLVMR